MKTLIFLFVAMVYTTRAFAAPFVMVPILADNPQAATEGTFLFEGGVFGAGAYILKTVIDTDPDGPKFDFLAPVWVELATILIDQEPIAQGGRNEALGWQEMGNVTLGVALGALIPTIIF